MNQIRHFHSFTHKQAVFRICCAQIEAVKQEIIRQRKILEEYIERHTEFKTSLYPIELLSDAPEISKRMAATARLVGVGPMAAVAGVMAQCAAEAGLRAGAPEAIIDNGGDIYLQVVSPAVIGLYPGAGLSVAHLGFCIEPEQTPVSICSSSSKMGHSMSLGRCDLATVVSNNAALADAAATQAANIVKTANDIEPALNKISQIEGIRGVLIVKDGQIGMAGDLPKLVEIK